MPEAALYRPGYPAMGAPDRPEVGLLDRVTRGLILINLFISVVFPHSFQLVSAAVMAVTTVFCLFSLKYSDFLQRLLPLYLLGILVSAFYIWLGFTHRAPLASVLQNAAVYIVSPFAWLIIATTTLQQFGITKVVRIFVWLALAAVLSVAMFFFAFLTFGQEAVSFLTEEANVNLEGGYAGAFILVYGSLIFLSGAVFAEPNVLKNRLVRILLPGLLVITAITSGRSALILAIPVGFLFGSIVRSRTAAFTSAEERSSFFLPTLLIAMIMFVAVAVIDIFVDRIDLTIIFTEFFDELSSGGGSLRTDQMSALIQGILDTYGLGAGHGIGVDYVRSYDFPWRYEVIPLATLYRVGVIGTVVYTLIFIVYGLAFAQKLESQTLREEDVFMAGGFIAAAIAVFTNPYIESFIFQWMYFIPVLSIGVVGLDKSTAGNR